MPHARYFFDAHDSVTFVRDEIGVDLAGLGEARRAAIEGLGCMAKVSLRDGELRNLTVTVRDGSEREVLTASLTAAADEPEIAG